MSSDSTTGAKGPKPSDWHVARKGVKRCPICDAPATLVRRTEHRATTPADKTDARWFKRSKSPKTWRITPVGQPRRSAPKKPREPAHQGPTPKTACILGQAALLMAPGQSMGQAADTLGISRRNLYAYVESHGDLFKREYEAAKLRFNALAEQAVRDGEAEGPASWAATLLKLKQEHVELNGRILTKQSAERPPLSPEMTLTQFFHVYAWPFCLRAKGDSDRTQEAYLSTLRRWAQLTEDPPLNRITKETCSTFLELLAELPGLSREKMSPNSVRNHWAVIGRLLKWTGPASMFNPYGANLVATPPWLPMPRKHRQPPRPAFTLEEISRWLAVLPATARPLRKIEGFDAATWWRALILVMYNTSIRPGALLRLEWSMIDRHRVSIPASIAKGFEGRILWLNDPALNALAPLQRSSGLVFRWPNWPRGETTLKKHRIKQLDAAAVPRRSFYALRRAFSTQCAKINVIALELMMGHKGLGTQMAIEHYIDAEEVLADALAKLPQPGPPDQAEQNAA